MRDHIPDNERESFRLDNLEKKNIYQVPNGYFDDLPGIIQSKVVKKAPFYTTNIFKVTTRYALPAICLVLLVVYAGLFRTQSEIENYDSLLSSVSDEELLAYLNESDISVEEIIESVGEEEIALGFDSDAASLIEELTIDDENLDELIEEFEDLTDYY